MYGNQKGGLFFGSWGEGLGSLGIMVITLEHNKPAIDSCNQHIMKMFICHKRGAKSKIWVPRENSNPSLLITGHMLYHSLPQSTTELQRTCGEPGHVLGSYVTRALYTATILGKSPRDTLEKHTQKEHTLYFVSYILRKTLALLF